MAPIGESRDQQKQLTGNRRNDAAHQKGEA
jgi:hypothetical protein